MNFISNFKKFKDWLEFFIRNTPGSIGNAIRNFYLKTRILKSFKNNRFETGLRIEYQRIYL